MRIIIIRTMLAKLGVNLLSIPSFLRKVVASAVVLVVAVIVGKMIDTHGDDDRDDTAMETTVL